MFCNFQSKKEKKTIKCEIKNVCQHFLKYTLREGLLTGRRWQPYFDSIYKKIKKIFNSDINTGPQLRMSYC